MMSDLDLMDSAMVPKHKYEATLRLLRIREDELRDRLGPCSTAHCTLHSAHDGPCNIVAPK